MDGLDELPSILHHPLNSPMDVDFCMQMDNDSPVGTLAEYMDDHRLGDDIDFFAENYSPTSEKSISKAVPPLDIFSLRPIKGSQEKTTRVIPPVEHFEYALHTSTRDPPIKPGIPSCNSSFSSQDQLETLRRSFNNLRKIHEVSYEASLSRPSIRDHPARESYKSKYPILEVPSSQLPENSVEAPVLREELLPVADTPADTKSKFMAMKQQLHSTQPLTNISQGIIVPVPQRFKKANQPTQVVANSTKLLDLQTLKRRYMPKGNATAVDNQPTEEGQKHNDDQSYRDSSTDKETKSLQDTLVRGRRISVGNKDNSLNTSTASKRVVFSSKPHSRSIGPTSIMSQSDTRISRCIVPKSPVEFVNVKEKLTHMTTNTNRMKSSKLKKVILPTPSKHTGNLFLSQWTPKGPTIPKQPNLFRDPSLLSTMPHRPSTPISIADTTPIFSTSTLINSSSTLLRPGVVPPPQHRKGSEHKPQQSVKRQKKKTSQTVRGLTEALTVGDEMELTDIQILPDTPLLTRYKKVFLTQGHSAKKSKDKDGERTSTSTFGDRAVPRMTDAVGVQSKYKY